MSQAPSYGALPMEHKRVLLQQAVAAEVAAGARVETQTDTYAVLVSGRSVNHPLHLMITVLTFGWWFWVWVALAIQGGQRRINVTVDDLGIVSRTKAWR